MGLLDSVQQRMGAQQAPTSRGGRMHADKTDVSKFQDMMKETRQSAVNQQPGRKSEFENAMKERTRPGSEQRGEQRGEQRPGMPSSQDLAELQRLQQDAQDEKAMNTVELSDLFSMQGSGTMTNANNVDKTMQTAQVPTMNPQDMETLVSRILVGANESGNQEVRLTINDGVLRNTEIAVSRDLNGNLAVRIQCNDPASFQTLVASRQTLQQSLDAKEKGLVSIDLRNENDEANDTNQRSRGLDESNYGYGSDGTSA